MASASAVAQVADLLSEFCTAEALSDEVSWRLRVALDELVANTVAYAVFDGKAAEFDVWFRRDGRTVEIVLADDGPPFDPLAHPAPDVSLPLGARQPGGLGIMLVRSLMDEVSYRRTTRNILTVRMRVDDDPHDGAEAGADENRAGD